MSWVKKFFSIMPAENIIVATNVAVVSLIGANVLFKNIKEMREENKFEEIGQDHMFLEKARKINWASQSHYLEQEH